MVYLPADDLSYGEDNLIEEPVTTKAWENFVSCLYRANVADICRYVSVTWSKNLAYNSLCIAVENFYDEEPYTCKIDLKTWQFWGKKGLKSFKVDEQRVDVYWDFKAAKFSSSSPEPCSDYYVALVSNGEVILVLGDKKTDALKRAKCRLSSVEATLVHKKENVFGKKSFCARTMLGNGEKEHVVFIETSLEYDPEMWIGIDGVELIRVNNLHWRFRGNESVMVDDMPIHIFWDVHDWLYCGGPDSGPGMFILMQGSVEGEPSSPRNGSNIDFRCDSTSWELPLGVEMCHFVYAWMDE